MIDLESLDYAVADKEVVGNSLRGNRQRNEQLEKSQVNTYTNTATKKTGDRPRANRNSQPRIILRRICKNSRTLCEQKKSLFSSNYTFAGDDDVERKRNMSACYKRISIFYDSAWRPIADEPQTISHKYLHGRAARGLGLRLTR